MIYSRALTGTNERKPRSLKGTLASAAALALLFLTGASAQASIVTWTDWQSVSAWNGSTQSAYGQLVNGGDVVDITLTSNSAFFGWALSGSPYWTGSAYTNGIVDNSPLGQDQIMLGAGGTITVTFSQAIDTPLIAINSWNRNTVNFSKDIVFDSYGAGYWGNGTPILNGTSGFYGSGEVHGVVRMDGATSSFDMTHTSEGWHGLTIAVVSTSVPEPGTTGIFGLSLILLGAFRKRVLVGGED